MSDSGSSPERLRREANAWLQRLISGEATTEDAAALDRWQAASPAHRAAFIEAKKLWRKLGPPAEESMANRPVVLDQRYKARRIGRRVFFGVTAGAATASAVVAIMEYPPLGLWPSLAELNADVRTAKGQQRQITLSAASVELNTQTSVTLRPAAGNADQIVLISGEAAVRTTPAASPLSVVVIAGNGRTSARQASFSVRYTGELACVTCGAGQVDVEHAEATATLRPGQQVTYGGGALGGVETVDLSVVMAWQQGLLVFRNAPLAEVIDEINRYRPGRIILMNAELGRQPVYESFRIAYIEEAVPRMQIAFGFHVTALPAGVLLIS